MNLELLTYPARPMNGGPLHKSAPKLGQWAYEPKPNEIRGLIHTPTGRIWNRHGQPSSTPELWATALARLQVAAAPHHLDWFDVGLFGRRIQPGSGAILIFDAPNIPGTYTQRRAILQHLAPTLDLGDFIPADSLRLIPTFHPDGAGLLWRELIQLNQRLMAQAGITQPVYEGLVAKRLDSTYPIQLEDPTREFPHWIKHRFI